VKPSSIELNGRLENVIGTSQTKIAGWSRYIQLINEPKVRLLEYGHRITAVAKTLDQTDFGTMVLAILEPGPNDTASEPIEVNAEKKIVGSLGRKIVMKPGESATVTFLITWHFPNLIMGPPDSMKGHHYAVRFDSATSVARYIAENFGRLYGQTKLWCETWYEQSTLPHWFLERTLANTSILATSTCFRFAGDGSMRMRSRLLSRDLHHVWLYEQTMGRLFPELDRVLREVVDFSVAFNEKTGGIGMRGEIPNQSPHRAGR